MTKNMKYRHALRGYEIACERVADAFIAQYFPGRDWKWVDGHIGGRIYVGDSMYTVADMVASIDFLPPQQTVEDWYRYGHNEEWGEFRSYLLSNDV